MNAEALFSILLSCVEDKDPSVKDAATKAIGMKSYKNQESLFSF